MDFLQQPFSWYVAGPLITVNLFLLFYFGQRFGISTGMKTVCAALGAGNKYHFFKYNWKADSWLLIYILGTVIGGYIAFHFFNAGAPVVVAEKTAAALQQLHIAANQSFEPAEIFALQNAFSLKGILLLSIGGFLIGFGTRWANGCTSGHAIAGLSDLQLPSLIAVIGFFIGGLLMTHLIIPFLFK
ncbi:MAG: YeeE/YedE thiosulfate transporter family protein [Chitinophagales bacterium]|nr:YeeE/YedE thiosulfate transporter family protein [Chitinophagales bacterium]